MECDRGLNGDVKTKDLANKPQGEEKNSTDEFYWWKTITNRFHQERDAQDVSKNRRIILLGKMDGRSVLPNI
jgi:hypothetical protein